MMLALLAAATISPCQLPPGWGAIAALKPRYVLFGEVHGTEQSPAMVGRTACALARRGERVLVAVELASTGNAALQSAWRTADREFRTGLTARMPGWKDRRDGVASEAMLGMLADLHALKSRGRRIDVVAFNGPRDAAQAARFKDRPGQGPHEAAQAENIRQAAERGRYDHVLVLVGNLHARKRPVERGGVSYEPMAMRLAPAGQVVSLNMVSGPGTMWNCLLRPGATLTPGVPPNPADIDCALHPTRGVDGMAGPPKLGLRGGKGAPQVDPAYDGFYWLGPATGSPPAAVSDEGRQAPAG